jgi:hypothetical protein
VTGLAVFSVEAVLMAIIESNKIHAPGPECNMQKGSTGNYPCENPKITR